MSDFILYFICYVILYIFLLAGIEFANGKSEKIRKWLLCIIGFSFSAYIALCFCLKDKTISVEAVEKEWNRYADYCKENQISWSEITFPEWLELESETSFDYYE